MYKVLGSKGSRITRVLWMLEEVGQPYEIENAKPQSEAARAVNPSGKVPVLLIDGTPLTDSAAICAYLGEKHPEAGMASRNVEERAQLDSWMEFAQSELEAPLWNKLKHRFILPDELKTEVGPWTAWEFATNLKAAERRIGGNEFAMGDRFTAVDVILGHIAQWARAGKFAVESQAMNDYFDRVLARPALAKAREREDAM